MHDIVAKVCDRIIAHLKQSLQVISWRLGSTSFANLHKGWFVGSEDVIHKDITWWLLLLRGIAILVLHTQHVLLLCEKLLLLLLLDLALDLVVDFATLPSKSLCCFLRRLSRIHLNVLVLLLLLMMLLIHSKMRRLLLLRWRRRWLILILLLLLLLLLLILSSYDPFDLK
jgi:hypothetical protein